MHHGHIIRELKAAFRNETLSVQRAQSLSNPEVNNQSGFTG